MDLTMPPTAIPLSKLAKRLARKESEIQRLRRKYENRLAGLKDRREQLADQLRRIEAEIQAAPGGGPEAEAATAKAPASRGRRRGKPRLADFIVTLLKAAGKPQTVKQLAQEIKRRRYPSKSRNLSGVVQTRLVEMVKSGILTRPKDQRGYVLASADGHSLGSLAGNGSAKPVKRAYRRSSAGVRGSQPPLRDVLTRLLAESKEPIGGGELAKMALDTGYKSKSKSFRDVVWVNLGNMKNVEHVAGKGYRLKKR
jgi:hypothetical protein